jgi:hypothetical protein
MIPANAVQDAREQRATCWSPEAFEPAADGLLASLRRLKCSAETRQLQRDPHTLPVDLLKHPLESRYE